ncbi:hypothetical protein B0I08_10722 [Glaciihabitans tibetensis]|uniref:SipW-cognate class signal peptide n=1 Tax=Glaciihabitans tibetensis TaxID=1266600 RepID=A0A2T0VA99_9MICO|nr:hypothetical protein [Glaciihabitans tibetensis]PRY67129.1 hypothetical protein B0I08_10722 [Glaciihabitans tibetensis]
MRERSKFSKKTTVIAISAVLLLAGGGAAFAYWTTTGTGTGTAAVGTNEAVTAVQTSVPVAMYPGNAAQTLSGNFTNPNDGPAYVATVTASIDSVTPGSATALGCTAADFTLANPEMTVGADVAAGTAVGAWTGATIQMINSGTNQDDCKDALVTFSYVVE